MASKGLNGAAAVFDFVEQKYAFRDANNVPRWGSVEADTTFSRASAAGRWPEAGPYEMVGSGVLRYDHNPVTREPLGVRMEVAGNNLLTYSEFQNGVTDAPSRSGLVSATALSGFAGAILIQRGADSSWAYKIVPVTAGTSYAFTSFVQFGDGTTPPVFSAGVAGTDAIINVASSWVMPSHIDHLGGGLYRVVGTHTPTTTGSGLFGVAKLATQSATPVVVTGYQVEAGAVASSYIVTGASAVTRAAERLYAPMPFDPADEGLTILWDGVLPVSAESTPIAYSIKSSDPVILNRIQTYCSGGLVYARGFNQNGSAWAPPLTRPFVARERRRIITRITPSVIALSQNGDAVSSTVLTGSIPTGMTRFEVGSVNGGNQWNSTISRVAVWKGTPFSDAQMREISAL
jgi:hypothetical protein